MIYSLNSVLSFVGQSERSANAALLKVKKMIAQCVGLVYERRLEDEVRIRLPESLDDIAVDPYMRKAFDQLPSLLFRSSSANHFD